MGPRYYGEWGHSGNCHRHKHPFKCFVIQKPFDERLSRICVKSWTTKISEIEQTEGVNNV